jgi:DNA modification methylase
MKAVTEKVECLGKTFTSEEERKEYFRDELRKKLPELKKIEGFPIGEDEDIINLSDPPYYTACPNPWLNDFISEWEKEKENIKGRKKNFHINEPYASDVSEGKNNPIYNAHSYHTKVPHPAIMRYILHYTQPGDTVFDGFAGTGMTGVAAQLCENPDPETKYVIEKEFKDLGLDIPFWGARNAILGDISSVAAFISYNYNTSTDNYIFEDEARHLLNEIQTECNWMYETKHTNGSKGIIDYTLWSDVFTCPDCNGEIVFWDAAIDKELGEVKDEFRCPHCNSQHTKRTLEKTWITLYDSSLAQTIRQTKTVPVLISYKIGNKRFEKKPDYEDLLLIQKIESMPIPYKIKANELPTGYNTEQPKRSNGFTHVHHFFTKRNLWSILSYINRNRNVRNLFLITAITSDVSKMARLKVGYYFKGGGGPFIPGLAGTLYIPSLSVEKRALFALENRLKTISTSLPKLKGHRGVTLTGSASDMKNMASNSVDYIFTDPPFGSNIMYSELNYISEAWLKVKTDNRSEAIENKTQGKSLLDYQSIMTKCFEEYYRVLKPSKWMTVEFSNTSAAVWNGIQTAIQRAGFIVANVAGLDKKQGSFKAVTTPTAVKQDLVISCYKSSEEFEKRFNTIQGDITVWDFVSEHLNHLPIYLKNTNSTTAIIERSAKALFDRLITFYLMRGLSIPIDARDFQDGLKQRFSERDGMYFTAEQAAEYDEKKAKSPQSVQLSLIVTSESDAIEWLKDRLRKLSQKYQDIMPDFRKATQSLRKGDTLPELQDILNENFIQDSAGKWRTPNPNEAKDREALRTKVLLKEFNTYVTAISQPKAKKLKEVRVEALRAGFKNCWEQKDFKTIVSLGDMIPQNILLEDEQLLMYYDIAKDRV